MRRPILHIAEILAWADAHHERTGKWPNANSGQIHDATRAETWGAMEAALRDGHRGLRPGGSLARLLEKHRGVRNIQNLPKLTRAKVVRWARQHRKSTGRWPNLHSGPVAGTNGETWSGIHSVLSSGSRGFSKGGSLARLLESTLGVRNTANLRPLSEAKILAWADFHHHKTGDWPTIESGVIHGSPGEKWSAIQTALCDGLRGLAGGTSLARLLATHRGVERHLRGRQLSAATVLGWARSHYRRTGKLPSARSGPLHGKPSETWGALHVALVYGYRGLPKGATLAKLLAPLKEKLANSIRR
jgi:hypothetical protein